MLWCVASGWRRSWCLVRRFARRQRRQDFQAELGQDGGCWSGAVLRRSSESRDLDCRSRTSQRVSRIATVGRQILCSRYRAAPPHYARLGRRHTGCAGVQLRYTCEVCRVHGLGEHCISMDHASASPSGLFSCCRLSMASTRACSRAMEHDSSIPSTSPQRPTCQCGLEFALGRSVRKRPSALPPKRRPGSHPL